MDNALRFSHCGIRVHPCCLCLTKAYAHTYNFLIVSKCYCDSVLQVKSADTVTPVPRTNSSWVHSPFVSAHEMFIKTSVQDCLLLHEGTNSATLIHNPLKACYKCSNPSLISQRLQQATMQFYNDASDLVNDRVKFVKINKYMLLQISDNFWRAGTVWTALFLLVCSEN